MTLAIDLNADLGENPVSLHDGNDVAMLDIVTSASIACGFHAGDPLQMSELVAEALARGVVIGAHPGFNDRPGFGRRRPSAIEPGKLEAELVYQIGALQGIVKSKKGKVRHVKLHGALANMACENFDLAQTCVRATRAVDPALVLLVMPGTQMEKAALAAGSPVITEIYADRAYNRDGTLVSRDRPGAVIEDPQRAADRMLELLETGRLTSIDGEKIILRGQSICVHGDNARAVTMAQTLRNRLEKAGIRVSPPSGS